MGDFAWKGRRVVSERVEPGFTENIGIKITTGLESSLTTKGVGVGIGVTGCRAAGEVRYAW